MRALPDPDRACNTHSDATNARLPDAGGA